MRTKRWRSYHRALKRQESWAIKIAKSNPLTQALHRFYAGVTLGLVYGDSPFMKPLKPKSDWFGAYIPLPVIYNTLRKRASYRRSKKGENT